MPRHGPQRDIFPGPDIDEFVLQRGRLPRLGDAIAPWQYRGWLLYCVQLADSHPSLPGRWGHYFRTLEAAHLLQEPIPQIRFEDTLPPNGRKIIERCLDLIYRREYYWTAFHQFVEWLAWSLAVSAEIPRFAERPSVHRRESMRGNPYIDIIYLL